MIIEVDAIDVGSRELDCITVRSIQEWSLGEPRKCLDEWGLKPLTEPLFQHSEDRVLVELVVFAEMKHQWPLSPCVHGLVQHESHDLVEVETLQHHQGLIQPSLHLDLQH
ncbi:hypothetical protein Tco_1317125 [Tanacetum coccineum]